jgi:hypothetical protein
MALSKKPPPPACKRANGNPVKGKTCAYFQTSRRLLVAQTSIRRYPIFPQHPTDIKNWRSHSQSLDRNLTRPDSISYTAPTIFIRQYATRARPSGVLRICRTVQRTLHSTAPAVEFWQPGQDVVHQNLNSRAVPCALVFRSQGGVDCPAPVVAEYDEQSAAEAVDKPDNGVVHFARWGPACRFPLCGPAANARGGGGREITADAVAH